MRLVCASASLAPAPRSSRGVEQRSGWQQGGRDGGCTPTPCAVPPGRDEQGGEPSSATRTRGSPTGRDEAGGLVRVQWDDIAATDTVSAA